MSENKKLKAISKRAASAASWLGFACKGPEEHTGERSIPVFAALAEDTAMASNPGERDIFKFRLSRPKWAPLWNTMFLRSVLYAILGTDNWDSIKN